MSWNHGFHDLDQFELRTARSVPKFVGRHIRCSALFVRHSCAFCAMFTLCCKTLEKYSCSHSFNLSMARPTNRTYSCVIHAPFVQRPFFITNPLKGFVQTFVQRCIANSQVGLKESMCPAVPIFDCARRSGRNLKNIFQNVRFAASLVKLISMLIILLISNQISIKSFILCTKRHEFYK